MINNNCCRVVLTGGPGGGKTTAAELFRRELGEQVVVVPEAATILYRGGFPRSDDPEVKKSIQSAIYHVQRNLEDIQSAHYKSRILICDRGTIDGAAYWPGEEKGFFDFMSTSIENELSRYDAVVFFETAAVGGISIEESRSTRIETESQAIALDKKLKKLWSLHPNFHFVPHETSFLHKISSALQVMAKIVEKQSRC